jgi:virginiamycin B lyase
MKTATLSVPQTTLHAFYPSTQTATVSAFDGDGNLIVSDAYVDASGNPATINVSADQSAGSTVVFSPSSISSPAPAGITFKYVPATLTTLQQYDGFTSTLTAAPSDGGTAGSTLTVLAPEVTEYSVVFATGLRFITLVASGPDGQIWFSGEEGVAPIIGTLSLAPQPIINQFLVPVPVASWTPSSMTFGSDGAAWTASANVFARTTTGGNVSVFDLNPSILVNDVVSGPDGALWFTDQSGAIGQMTLGPSPSPTEFPIPTPSWGYGAAPAQITVGRDGALWFTDNGNNAIGRITTTGQITEFSGAVDPWGIAQGPDGAIWFTERAPNAIGRMTTNGTITTYPLATAESSPTVMIRGPDGALWFSEGLSSRIGRIETNGTLTAFPTPLLLARPNGITVGQDGAIWFAECGMGNIDRLQ